MYEETILNNLVLFARNVGEVEETDLMFKDQLQFFDSNIYKYLNYDVTSKQKLISKSVTSDSD